MNILAIIGLIIVGSGSVNVTIIAFNYGYGLHAIGTLCIGIASALAIWVCRGTFDRSYYKPHLTNTSILRTRPWWQRDTFMSVISALLYITGVGIFLYLLVIHVFKLV